MIAYAHPSDTHLTLGPVRTIIFPTDAKFHYVVERTSLRESSPSWEKVSAESSVSVPTEMMAWVGGSNGESHSVTESSASHADAHEGEVATTTAATPMEPAQR